MLRVIRRNVFETNSSSTHSLTMTSKEEYNKWKNGEMLFNDGEFTTREKAIEDLKKQEWFNKHNPDFDFTDEDRVNEALREEEYYTYKEYWNYKEEDYETFEDTYETSKGDEVVAFGYYGHN